MKIAIYSRKSKSTDKGESIDNQIHMCKEYANIHFDMPEFFIFQDEGFSGGNTNRPQFQTLLSELKKGMYDVLICYRLDRVSRNVSDFSSTLDMLTKHNIGFVSIKENFDTTTPMGRAMIHISSVFAQLERETIAERIKDNMLELSKTGRWLGGTSPLGYMSKKIAYESNGKTKHYAILELDDSTEHLVRLIYDKYLELGSISKVETYLLQEQIKTPTGSNFRSNTIRNILINPVYCAADQTSYEYFIKLGCILPDNIAFDNTYALMPYNRHKNGKSNLANDSSEWILAIGKHVPIINSATWLNVQRQIKNNHPLSIPSGGTTSALLGGLIYCKNCGAVMQVTNQDTLVDGTISYTYRCTTKLKSRGKICNIKNISKGYVLDEIVINRIRDMLKDKTNLIEELLNHKNEVLYRLSAENENKEKLENEIIENDNAIKKLIKKIVLFDDPDMEKYIQEEVKELHEKNILLKEQIDNINELANQNDFNMANIDIILASLEDFDVRIDKSTIHEKKQLIRNIIKRIEWDGDNVDIYFYFNNNPLSKECNSYHGSKITYA